MGIIMAEWEGECHCSECGRDLTNPPAVTSMAYFPEDGSEPRPVCDDCGYFANVELQEQHTASIAGDALHALLFDYADAEGIQIARHGQLERTISGPEGDSAPCRNQAWYGHTASLTRWQDGKSMGLTTRLDLAETLWALHAQTERCSASR